MWHRPLRSEGKNAFASLPVYILGSRRDLRVGVERLFKVWHSWAFACQSSNHDILENLPVSLQSSWTITSMHVRWDRPYPHDEAILGFRISFVISSLVLFVCFYEYATKEAVPRLNIRSAEVEHQECWGLLKKALILVAVWIFNGMFPNFCLWKTNACYRNRTKIAANISSWCLMSGDGYPLDGRDKATFLWMQLILVYTYFGMRSNWLRLLCASKLPCVHSGVIYCLQRFVQWLPQHKMQVNK